MKHTSLSLLSLADPPALQKYSENAATLDLKEGRKGGGCVASVNKQKCIVTKAGSSLKYEVVN